MRGTGIRKEGFRAVGLLAAGLLALRLLWPGAAAQMRELVISRRGEQAAAAFFRGEAGEDAVRAVFGGVWDGPQDPPQP